MDRYLGSIVLMLLVSGCSGPDPGRSHQAAPGSTPAVTAGPTPDAGAPTTAEQELLDAFVAFAREPSRATAARLPAGDDGVRIGLGSRLVATLAPAAISDVRAWEIDGEYGGVTGPFSALAVVADHVDRPLADRTIGAPGALRFTAGRHDRCASPPGPVPTELSGLRQLAIQPGPDSTSSCLDWFAVDIFLTTSGAVEAVTVDVWDP